ncbi:MAG: PfkB family carbohydrate kinase [Acidimicrobiia bacterium]
MSARVTCVGLAVQDLVFSMGEPVLLGEKNFATALGAVGGGPAANAAVAIASLGGEASLVTALGHDAIGDEILTEIASHGVDCTRVRRTDAPSPLSAVIISPDGDRTIFNRTDPALWSIADPPTADELAGSDAILVDVRWPQGALAAIRCAATLGVPGVVDADLTDAPLSEELLASASHVVFSQPAFERLTAFTTPASVEAAARRYGGVVAVTKGSDGVLWSDGGTTRHVEAFRVRAVDTLGAGDVFHGAFALGLAEGRDLDDIVGWSSAVAAVKCGRGGGRSGFPSRADVDEFLEGSAS